MEVTVQIQSLIRGHRQDEAKRMLSAIANAVRVSNIRKNIGVCVTVCVGDLTDKPILTDGDWLTLQSDFSPYLTLRYSFLGNQNSFAEAHDLLAKNCDADFIGVMEFGAVVCPRFFEKILSPFAEKQKRAGIVEARRTPMELPKDYDRKTMKTDWASSQACLVVPTKLFRKLNGFDPQLDSQICNDIDFSKRVALKGYEIYYRPDCVVFVGSSCKKTSEVCAETDQLIYDQSVQFE